MLPLLSRLVGSRAPLVLRRNGAGNEGITTLLLKRRKITENSQQCTTNGVNILKSLLVYSWELAGVGRNTVRQSIERLSVS